MNPSVERRGTQDQAPNLEDSCDFLHNCLRTLTSAKCTATAEIVKPGKIREKCSQAPDLKALAHCQRFARLNEGGIRSQLVLCHSPSARGEITHEARTLQWVL
jgi:hypothetical protein